MKITKKYKPGEVTDIVLESVANYLIDWGPGLKPRLPVLLGYLIKIILEKRKEIRKSQIERVIKNLEKREAISIEERNGKTHVIVMEKGKQIVLKYSIKPILDFKRKEKKWNGRWFMVFFDVPEIQRNKRDYLRRLLKQLGFYQYQKSVYLFPYECEEEVKLIKQIVEGAKYMKYIIAARIEDEEMAKRYFRL